MYQLCYSIKPIHSWLHLLIQIANGEENTSVDVRFDTMQVTWLGLLVYIKLLNDKA